MKIEAVVESTHIEYDIQGKKQYAFIKPIYNNAIMEGLKIPCDDEMFELFNSGKTHVYLEINVKAV